MHLEKTCKRGLLFIIAEKLFETSEKAPQSHTIRLCHCSDSYIPKSVDVDSTKATTLKPTEENINKDPAINENIGCSFLQSDNKRESSEVKCRLLLTYL